MSYFIDYKQFIDVNIPFYAHKRGSHEKELLGEHIECCEHYFNKLAEEKNIKGVLKRFVRMMEFEDEESAYELIEEMLYQIIVFHDFGKINPKFQYEKMGNELFKNTEYGGISGSEHSMLSSILYLDYYLGKLEDVKKQFDTNDRKKLKVIVFENAYIISKHHGDFDSIGKYTEKIKSSSIKELISNLSHNGIPGYKGFSEDCDDAIKLNLRYMRPDNLQIVANLYSKNVLLKDLSAEQKRRINVANMFYVRFAYSLLVSCDYYATTEYSSGLINDSFGNLRNFEEFRNDYENSQIMKSIRQYEKEKYGAYNGNFGEITEINDLRCEIFLDAEREMEKSGLEENDYLYFLEAPTGSGKSNIALNLSFNIHSDLKKIFYIYPFNSLVEQNRKNLTELFSRESCLNQIQVVNSITPMGKLKKQKENDKDNDNEKTEIEISMNLGSSNPDEDEAINYYEKILLDRQFLNYPFILSTHVSFFNTLFGRKREDIFGFLQLSGSVVVLDEIQSYKNKIWAEIIILLKICAELMDMKIIIMSATLPGLDVLDDSNYGFRYLVPDSRKYFMHPIFKNRVELCWDLLDGKTELEDLYSHIVEASDNNKKILVEFITKNSAYEFFNMLVKRGDVSEPVALLTGDDSIYDREKILAPLRKGSAEGMILVSTQVVEAGVDIDMDVGYKNISLLDSEEQFLGRINRSCRRTGKAYFFILDEASKIYKDDYRQESEMTLKNDKMRTVLENKEFGTYYLQIMGVVKKNRNNSTDKDGLESFFNNTVKYLNFEEIQDRMKLIDEDSWNTNVVICRKIELDDGEILDGFEAWENYKAILMDYEMEYAEKQYRLSVARSNLSYFTYTIKKNSDIYYNDSIGELKCIEDGEKFFVNGKLDRNSFLSAGAIFIDI